MNEKRMKTVSALTLAASYVLAFALNLEGMLFGSGKLTVFGVLGSVLYVAAWLVFTYAFAAKSKSANTVMLVMWACLAVFTLANVVKPLPDAVGIPLAAVLFTPLYGVGAQDVTKPLLPIAVSAVFLILSTGNYIHIKRKA